MSQTHYRTAQNICSATCPVDHIKSESQDIKEPSGSWPDIRGLNSLNFSRTAWLTGDAIEVSLTTYKRGLPQRLQNKIDIVIPGVDPNLWHTGNAGSSALSTAILRPARRALARMKQTEYSILPISTNGKHWVLVVMHKEQRESAGKTEYSHVAQIAVLDPFHDNARAQMVFHQMSQWLQRAGSFTFSPRPMRRVWVPTQRDSNSCGPRAYWNAKQIMDRLLELDELDISYDESIWRPLSGWFNDHFVRGEMIGRCAWDGVRAMDYNARVAIECVNRVRDFKAGRAAWSKAGEAMAPPDLTSETPQKRPDQSQRRQSGVLPDRGSSKPTPENPQTPEKPQLPAGVPDVADSGRGVIDLATPPTAPKKITPLLKPTSNPYQTPSKPRGVVFASAGDERDPKTANPKPALPTPYPTPNTPTAVRSNRNPPVISPLGTTTTAPPGLIAPKRKRLLGPDADDGINLPGPKRKK